MNTVLRVVGVVVRGACLSGGLSVAVCEGNEEEGSVISKAGVV